MELDDLKSAWKAVPEEKKYSQNKIVEMLKKKSSSTIKFLFQFTLVEFILVLIFTTITIVKGELVFGQNNHLKESTNYENYMYGSILTILFTFCLLIYSYTTYKSININQSTKKLIEKIVAYRNIVNIFIIGVSIALIIVSIPYYYDLGRAIYIEKLNNIFTEERANLMGLIAVGVATFFIAFITLVYYCVIYFLFLKKLNENLKQLKSFN